VSKRPAELSEVSAVHEVSDAAAAATTAVLQQRHDRIATGAYLRAAARNFIGGDPMEDWLAAEAEEDRAASP